MTTTLILSCPHCHKQMRASQEILDRKVRCKGCGEVFTARRNTPPARPTPPPTQAKSAPPPTSKAQQEKDEWNDRSPYAVTDLDLTPRCPHCAHEMESRQAIICINCGYNTQTREHGKTLKVIQTTLGEWVLWLAPGILCALLLLPLSYVHVYLWLARTNIQTSLPVLEYTPTAEITIGQKDDEAKKQVDAMLPARIWGSVAAAAAMYGCGWFAVRRLILNPHPPLKIKN